MSTLERVKELCAFQGISVSELETTLSIPKNTIYQWNSKKPNLEKIEKIADYFNVSTDYLLGRSDIKQRADDLEGLTTEERLALTKENDFATLSPKEEETVKRFIKYVLRNEN